MSDTVEAARGKWFGLLTHFGVDSRFLTKKHCPCPMCGGKDRFIWDNKDDRGTYHCNQCGAGSGFTLLSKFKNWTMKQAISEVGKIVGTMDKKMENRTELSEEQKKHALNQTWSASISPSEGDPVYTYLKNRTGLLQPPKSIRYHPSLWHSEERKNYHGMLARITDKENKPVSIHRTYLTEDGHKAKISKAKMLMSASIPDGSAIRLCPYQNVLGIAEGIETAFSCTNIFNVPTWAAISAPLLLKWTPPDNLEKLVIFADNDRNFVGQLTAYKLAWQLHRADQNLKIYVVIPSVTGGDWNDILTLYGVEQARADAQIQFPAVFRATSDG